MTSTKTYSVYEKWYSILKWISDRCDNFPKKVKSTFTDRILNIAYDIMEMIIEALYSSKKIKILKTINILLEKLRIFFRISFDRQYISIKQHQFISNEMNSFGGIIGNWIKQCK